jgi:hypothetical protein
MHGGDYQATKITAMAKRRRFSRYSTKSAVSVSPDRDLGHRSIDWSLKFVTRVI